MPGSTTPMSLLWNWTRLDNRSTTAGAPPLYGTWVASKPAACFSISIERWLMTPTPPELYAIVLLFAYFTSSDTLFTGTAAFTTVMSGDDPRIDTGTRSLSKLYLRLE